MPPWIITTDALRPSSVRDPAFQVVQGVAVLGEENELLRRRRDWFGNWSGVALVRCPVFRHSTGDRRRREYFRSRVASSRHFLSSLLRRMDDASASRRLSVSISVRNSAMLRAAVAWSRISSSAA